MSDSSRAGGDVQSLSPTLLALLRCPLTGATLVQEGDMLVARHEGQAYRYPIREGIPQLLADAVVKSGDGTA